MFKCIYLIFFLFKKAYPQLQNLQEYQPEKPSWSLGESGNGVVSWKPPDELMLSTDFVLVVELVTDKQYNTTKNNPYGKTEEWKTHKKQFSHADEDGIIRIEIDKDIIEEHEVTNVKVKILNIDYESSLYSREVPIVNKLVETEEISNKLSEAMVETESSGGLKTET